MMAKLLFIRALPTAQNPGNQMILLKESYLYLAAEAEEADVPVELRDAAIPSQVLLASTSISPLSTMNDINELLNRKDGDETMGRRDIENRD